MNRPKSVEERLGRLKSVAPPADLEQRIKRAIPDQLPISAELDRQRLRGNVRSVWRVVLAIVALLLLLLALILLMRSDTGETPTNPPSKAALKLDWSSPVSYRDEASRDTQEGQSRRSTRSSRPGDCRPG